MARQTRCDISPSISSATAKAFNSAASARARWATDAAMPSSRIRVSASPAASSVSALVPRHDETGTCAAPDTSKGEPSAVPIAWPAVVASRPRSTSVRSLSARGITFSVTSVITDSVPHDPATSLQRS